MNQVTGKYHIAARDHCKIKGTDSQGLENWSDAEKRNVQKLSSCVSDKSHIFYMRADEDIPFLTECNAIFLFQFSPKTL